MTSDGFSVKTTISQLANVARAQAKGQASQPVNPAADKLLKNEKRVDRVKSSEEVEKQKINPDRGRKHEHAGASDEESRGDLQDTASDESESAGTSVDSESEDASKGVMLDTKA